MNKMYNKINTVSELIEMLEILKKQINPDLSSQHMTTVIEDVHPDSVKFVINDTINYLQSTMDEKPEV